MNERNFTLDAIDKIAGERDNLRIERDALRDSLDSLRCALDLAWPSGEVRNLRAKFTAELAQVTGQRDALLAALRQVIAALEQPVQFTDPPSEQATAILRGDCAAARGMARAAIALVGGGK